MSGERDERKTIKNKGKERKRCRERRIRGKKRKKSS